MNSLLFLAFCFFLQAEVPFKNSGEFQVAINLKYRIKPAEYKENNYLPNGMRIDKNQGENLPFLLIDVTEIKIVGDEVKMRAVDSSGKVIFKRKSSNKNFQIEMGFVDDLKAGVTANEVSIYFLSEEKTELRKIVMTVLPDGTFQVNGKWHGKF